MINLCECLIQARNNSGSSEGNPRTPWNSSGEVLEHVLGILGKSWGLWINSWKSSGSSWESLEPWGSPRTCFVSSWKCMTILEHALGILGKSRGLWGKGKTREGRRGKYYAHGKVRKTREGHPGEVMGSLLVFPWQFLGESRCGSDSWRISLPLKELNTYYLIFSNDNISLSVCSNAVNSHNASRYRGAPDNNDEYNNKH